jgi:hypothetical protein
MCSSVWQDRLVKIKMFNKYRVYMCIYITIYYSTVILKIIQFNLFPVVLSTASSGVYRDLVFLFKLE